MKEKKERDRGYKKVKRLYHPYTLYFECEAEKKKVMQYAESVGKSTRQYILQLVFEKKEPEILIDKQRKNRRMKINKNTASEKKYANQYVLLVPIESYNIFKRKAALRNMDVSSYVVARIREDLKEHGVILDYQEPYQFLILYKLGDEEQDCYANTIDDAMQLIEKIKEEGATDILLVDTLSRKRKAF